MESFVKLLSILLSTLCLCVSSGWTQSLSAAEKPAVAQLPTTLRIGTMNLPPYGWIDKQGTPQGIIYAMNQEIGKRSGMVFTNQIYPFNRMLSMLKEGKLDLISSQAHQPALAAGDKLAVQFTINVIAATRKGSGIRSLADFKGRFLVYHHAATYPQLDNLPRQIQRVKSYRQALKILQERPNTDGAVFSEPAYYYWMKDSGLTPDDFGEVIMIEPNKKQWIFVRKDMADDFRETLKQVVEEIYREDLYQQLLERYKLP